MDALWADADYGGLTRSVNGPDAALADARLAMDHREMLLDRPVRVLVGPGSGLADQRGCGELRQVDASEWVTAADERGGILRPRRRQPPSPRQLARGAFGVCGLRMLVVRAEYMDCMAEGPLVFCVFLNRGTLADCVRRACTRDPGIPPSDTALDARMAAVGVLVMAEAMA